MEAGSVGVTSSSVWSAMCCAGLCATLLQGLGTAPSLAGVAARVHVADLARGSAISHGGGFSHLIEASIRPPAQCYRRRRQGFGPLFIVTGHLGMLGEQAGQLPLAAATQSWVRHRVGVAATLPQTTKEEENFCLPQHRGDFVDLSLESSGKKSI